jgi:hypothetical protein
VIRAIETVVVKAAANEMAPSNAKVLVADMRQVACVKATDVTSTKASNATAAEAAHVTSTKATHVASAKAAHVASAATVASATATAGLCTRGKKAAGKHRACQNHHHSSSHDILHLDGRTFRRRASSDVGVSQQSKRRRRDGLEMGMAIPRLY